MIIITLSEFNFVRGHVTRVLAYTSDLVYYVTYCVSAGTYILSVRTYVRTCIRLLSVRATRSGRPSLRIYH